MIYDLGDRRVELQGDNFVADNARVIGSVVLGRQASVWFGCVIRGDNDRITIGERSNIQDGSVLHVDEGVPLDIGREVSIGHKVMLHCCTVREGALVGINAVVLNHAVIGERSLVGANTLIPEGKEIPPESLVIGSPGRVVRRLEPEELEMIARIAGHYVEKSELYREALRPAAAGR
jgi:carbonic anhydrase/acetyltransferase-like protein (isoleucine patch superfamily)